MNIYTRTEKGNLAMRSEQDTIPRKLRSVLTVIDGKTPRSVYVNLLKNFGDVGILIDVLLQNGYIQEAHDSAFEPPKLANADSFASRASAPAATHNSSFLNQVSSASNESRAAELVEVITLMNDFIAEHLPSQAFEILLALENIRNKKQLLENFADYESLVAPLGKLAKAHLNIVKLALQ
jgi:hypothetical protein